MVRGNCCTVYTRLILDRKWKYGRFGVEEHDGEVRFKSRSGNMARCNASGHNYRNSFLIVDLAMGQIPCSTERISGYIK